MQNSIQHSVMILLCWIMNTIEIYYFRESALVKNWTNYLHSPNLRTCRGWQSTDYIIILAGFHKGILWGRQESKDVSHISNLG